MKSKFNLIALSFLMATTLSSASFASAQDFADEPSPTKKSSSTSLKKKLAIATTEAVLAGAIVGGSVYALDEAMSVNDLEHMRAKAATAIATLTAARSFIPPEMTAYEILMASPKFAVKAGCTLGGAYLMTAYYETVQSQLDALFSTTSSEWNLEEKKQARMAYAATGAALGNMAGNVINTSIDGLAWGVSKTAGGIKGLFKGMWSKPVETVSQEIEHDLDASDGEDEDLDALLGGIKIGGNLAALRSEVDDAERLLAAEAIENAKKKLNHKEEQWNGVVEASEEDFQQRTEKLKSSRMKKDLAYRDTSLDTSLDGNGSDSDTDSDSH